MYTPSSYKELVATTFEYSERIQNGRTAPFVLIYGMAEFGELGEEIAIAKGEIPGEPGKDGVFGEAVDLTLCALDFIWVSNPNASAGDVADLAREYMHQKHGDDTPDLDGWTPDLLTVVYEKTITRKIQETMSSIKNEIDIAWGKLAEEYLISEGRSFKEPHPAGVMGRAAELAAECLNLAITVHPNPEMACADVIDVVTKKLDKWESKYGELPSPS